MSLVAAQQFRTELVLGFRLLSESLEIPSATLDNV
jgi:hypothetical protein